jgi:hypothetical protein
MAVRLPGTQPSRPGLSAWSSTFPSRRTDFDSPGPSKGTSRFGRRPDVEQMLDRTCL